MRGSLLDDAGDRGDHQLHVLEVERADVAALGPLVDGAERVDRDRRGVLALRLDQHPGVDLLASLDGEVVRDVVALDFAVVQDDEQSDELGEPQPS